MFEKVIKSLKSVNMDKITLESFKESKEEAFDLNTEDQLFDRGVDSNDNTLGDYAPLSIKLRSEAGLPVDRITLRIEGDFHEGWDGDFDFWPINFFSNDEKTAELVFQFGEDIFGLTKGNLDFIIDDRIKKSVQEKSKKEFQESFESI